MSLFEVITTWVEGHTRGRDEDRLGFDNKQDAVDYANERAGDDDTNKVVIKNTDTGDEAEHYTKPADPEPEADPTQSGEPSAAGVDTLAGSGSSADSADPVVAEPDEITGQVDPAPVMQPDPAPPPVADGSTNT